MVMSYGGVLHRDVSRGGSMVACCTINIISVILVTPPPGSELYVLRRKPCTIDSQSAHKQACLRLFAEILWYNFEGTTYDTRSRKSCLAHTPHTNTTHTTNTHHTHHAHTDHTPHTPHTTSTHIHHAHHIRTSHTHTTHTPHTNTHHTHTPHTQTPHTNTTHTTHKHTPYTHHTTHTPHTHHTHTPHTHTHTPQTHTTHATCGYCYRLPGQASVHADVLVKLISNEKKHVQNTPTDDRV